MKPLKQNDPPDLRELEGEYVFLRELGRGATGLVYLAKHRMSGEFAAIKLLRPKYATVAETIDRLAREARTVARLAHPNIVRHYEFRPMRHGHFAIVMQYVAGETLAARLARTPRLPIPEVERVLRDIGRALEFAHTAGVVHRDIKPQNILIEEASGRALLSDFGIAKFAEGDANVTMDGMAIGTPSYMSPEQIDGKRLDGRSDLYGLGLVGWEMLVGVRPWTGETLYGVIYKQKHESLPPVEQLRPDVPPRVALAIGAVLQKKATMRLPSASEFLLQLESDQPTPVARARRWVSAALLDEDLAADAAAPTLQFPISPTSSPAPAAYAPVVPPPAAPPPVVSAPSAAPQPAAAPPVLAAPPVVDRPTTIEPPRVEFPEPPPAVAPAAAPPELAPAVADAPIARATVAEAPRAEEPLAEAPVAEAPAAEAAVAEAPALDAPVVAPPALEIRHVEVPALESRALETPALGTPAHESPAYESPAGEILATETPAAEPSAEEPPPVVRSAPSTLVVEAAVLRGPTAEPSVLRMPAAPPPIVGRPVVERPMVLRSASPPPIVAAPVAQTPVSRAPAEVAPARAAAPPPVIAASGPVLEATLDAERVEDAPTVVAAEPRPAQPARTPDPALTALRRRAVAPRVLQPPPQRRWRPRAVAAVALLLGVAGAGTIAATRADVGSGLRILRVAGSRNESPRAREDSATAGAHSDLRYASSAGVVDVGSATVASPVAARPKTAAPAPPEPAPAASPRPATKGAATAIGATKSGTPTTTVANPSRARPAAAGPSGRVGASTPALPRRTAATASASVAVPVAAVRSPLLDAASRHVVAGRFAAARPLIDSSIAVTPRSGRAYALRARVRMEQGRLREAWADAEMASRLGDRWGAEAATAMVEARARDTVAALTRAKRLAASLAGRETLSQDEGVHVAMALAVVGDHEGAASVLTRVRPVTSSLWTALHDPAFASLRRSGRYSAVVRSLERAARTAKAR